MSLKIRVVTLLTLFQTLDVKFHDGMSIVGHKCCHQSTDNCYQIVRLSIQLCVHNTVCQLHTSTAAETYFTHIYMHTYIHTYIQINLYSAKNRITNQRRWHRMIRQ